MSGFRFIRAIACGLTLISGSARGQFLQPPTAATNQRPFSDFNLSELDRGEEAEEVDEIETDRDSFTPATTTPGYRRLIVESAWSFIDNRAVPDTNSLPELVTRFGVNDWFELRLGWNWEAGGAANAISSGGSDTEVPTENAIERDS